MEEAVDELADVLRRVHKNVLDHAPRGALDDTRGLALVYIFYMILAVFGAQPTRAVTNAKILKYMATVNAPLLLQAWRAVRAASGPSRRRGGRSGPSWAHGTPPTRAWAPPTSAAAHR